MKMDRKTARKRLECFPLNISRTPKLSAFGQVKLDEAAEGSSTVDLAAIDVGDTLPSYTLKTEKDEDVDVATLTAEKGLILFLVPKADTRKLAPPYSLSESLTLPAGCTTQACGFRDAYPDFTSLNYEVYCLSADSPAAQTKWQAKVLPLFPPPSRRVY